MKKILVISIIMVLVSNVSYSQIQINSSGRVGVGSGPDFYANLNIAPQYSSPSSTNLIIGSWSSSYGLMSLGVHNDYSWIQSWNSKPLHINQQGNHVIIGSASVESVGIGYGMGTPSAKLHVIGNIYATGTITSSDERLKTNIKTLDYKTLNYKNMNAVTFNFDIKDRGFTMEGLDTTNVAKIDKEFYKRVHFGFIAQEVKEVFPELVYEDNEGYLAIDYQSFIPILFELIKGQKETIENLQSEIEEIQNNCCPDLNLKSASSNKENTDENKETILYQNIPNPFSENTKIGYSLADGVTNASIYVYDMNGTQLKGYELHHKGTGEISIQGNELKAGMYMYSLIADGKVIDTKKMVLTD